MKKKVVVGLIALILLVLVATAVYSFILSSPEVWVEQDCFRYMGGIESGGIRILEFEGLWLEEWKVEKTIYYDIFPLGNGIVISWRFPVTIYREDYCPSVPIYDV